MGPLRLQLCINRINGSSLEGFLYDKCEVEEKHNGEIMYYSLL